MLGKAVTRIASTLAAVLLLIASSASSGHAQATTGKIQGRVVSTTGQPIASAQVTVDGTRLGNTSNDDGFYFINDVPAGLQTIRVQSIGYRTVVLADERILAGQTTTLNFQLETAAIELEALVVAGERNPLVPRDQVSSRSIVSGETIDNLPIDQAASIILLQPGVITTNDGFSIRGGREGEHAVYVDGVPIRNLRTGATSTVEIGTNALAQVDVTTGGINARYGNAQSGVINYVTRTGGTQFGGSVSFMTDRLAWESIRGGFSRAEASLGGPVPFVSNLSFFTSTTLEGNKYGSQPQDHPIKVWVPMGIDTVFTMARAGQTSGATDSVRVVVPNFVEWDNGATLPTGVSDEINLTSRLTYGIGRGSRLDLTHYYNRNQAIGRNIRNIMNPDAWTGSLTSRNMATLGGYFLLAQTSERALALDLRVSYTDQWFQAGELDRSWQESHLFPTLGFNPGSLKFIFNPDDYPVTESMILALRSDVLPRRLINILPGYGGLGTLQSVRGMQVEPGQSTVLRMNPFAMNSAWTLSGIGNANQSYTQENRWYFSGTADWQMNRFNRLWIGGETTIADTKTMAVPLFDGLPAGSHYKPKTAGLYATNRLDIGDVVLEAGVRMDYYDPAGEFPRLPGFVTFLPDSLKGDSYRLRPGDEPWEQRLERIVDCGGAATAAQRTNAAGQVVCMNNFVPTKVRTTFSPKLAVAFPVTATSTFRLNYSHNVQPTALTTLLNFAATDLSSVNTNWPFGRDVDLPRTVAFEAGYRQVFGGNTVVDAAVYTSTTRNALTYRKELYTNPVNGADLFLNVLTNSDYSMRRGLDVRIDRKLSQLADVNINYTLVDAQGTGSDPNTYTGLILRRNTNVSIVTGQPVDPPELMMTLDQSRAHNLSGTLSVLLPADQMEHSRFGNAILGNLGIFATYRMASGLPYTRLQNVGDGQIGPPTVAGQGGTPAEDINASRGPALLAFDARVTKGFQVFGRGARAFADFRNPFNIANTGYVFTETGTTSNEVWREKVQRQLVLSQAGTGQLRDMDIATWQNENVINRYMLAQAERRFGNGDGIFTVEEQHAAWGSYIDYAGTFFGAPSAVSTVNFDGRAPWRMRRSDQALRLGLELTF
jgi:hypothetical protein